MNTLFIDLMISVEASYKPRTEKGHTIYYFVPLLLLENREFE